MDNLIQSLINIQDLIRAIAKDKDISEGAKYEDLGDYRSFIHEVETLFNISVDEEKLRNSTDATVLTIIYIARSETEKTAIREFLRIKKGGKIVTSDDVKEVDRTESFFEASESESLKDMVIKVFDSFELNLPSNTDYSKLNSPYPLVRAVTEAIKKKHLKNGKIVY